jgi:hypothetical protein
MKPAEVEPVALTFRVSADALTGPARALLFESLLHHVLFMRGQIPVPFGDLEACLTKAAAAEFQSPQAPRPRPGFCGGVSTIRKQSELRKLRRYVDEVVLICQGVRQFCLAVPTERISIYFGSSAKSPREMVTLQFASKNQATSFGGGERGKETDLMSRKLIREMLIAFSESPPAALPKSSALFVSIACQDGQGIEGQGAEVFALRDGFRAVPRKRGPPPIVLTIDAIDPGGGASYSPAPAIFVSRRGVRGLQRGTAACLGL